MGGWAEECEECGDLCYEVEMHEIQHEWYCNGCAEEKRAEIIRAADDDEEARTKVKVTRKCCAGCGEDKRESEFVERLSGWYCTTCSHIQEVAMLGYCDMKCAICKTNKGLAVKIERAMLPKVAAQ